MCLEREELKAATNRRMPGFREPSPKPNNFSEFSEVPEGRLHFNGKVLKALETMPSFTFSLKAKTVAVNKGQKHLLGLC